MEHAIFIPLYPLGSFLLLLLFGRKLKESSAYIGILLLACSLIHSVFILFERLQGANYKYEFSWLAIGDFTLSAGYEVNQLNVLMLVIVSSISFTVHLYSKAYMHGEERFSTFYAYLGLFTFAMLGLVLSPNLLQLYIFWELVGLGSFLLIGFYFYKEEAKAAAKKAFIMTRIGDIGLFIGMLLLFWEVGSFDYDVIFQAVDEQTIPTSMIMLTSILIFIGAMGKSGQFPLHTWLPDAMEGPTPVSALIHAATMVAAGVYLVATMYPLFAASETVLFIVACVGGLTAIFAASMAIVQNDIKRVLAYSTVSQLGYMMLALGVTGYVAGVFHLTTHAFFKALLFLAAGSVIHAVSSQQINQMGGLWKKLNVTAPLFLIGTLAISGFPLLSGFFSKEEILLATWNSGHYFLFAVAIVTALMTAFYMFRLFFLVFTGTFRGKEKVIHESSFWMLIPMVAISFFVILGGYIHTSWFGTFFGDWLVEGNARLGLGHLEGPLWITIVAMAVSFAGMACAYWLYVKHDWKVQELASFFYRLLKRKYYIDEIYQFTIVKPTKVIGLCFQWCEIYIIQGTIKRLGNGVLFISKKGAKWYSGQVQQYGTVVLYGIAIVLIIYAWTGGLL